MGQEKLILHQNKTNFWQQMSHFYSCANDCYQNCKVIITKTLRWNYHLTMDEKWPNYRGMAAWYLMSHQNRLGFYFWCSFSVEDKCNRDGMPCNVFVKGIDTSKDKEIKFLICCWKVVDIVSFIICSWLRLDCNTLVEARPKRVGPLQYQVRCMVSDWTSMKLPVPHLGHDDMIVFESDVIK